MDRLHLLWTFIVSHWLEITFAAVFAIIVAVIFELLDIGSRLRAGIAVCQNPVLADSSRTRPHEIRVSSKARPERAKALALARGKATRWRIRRESAPWAATD